LGDYDSTTESLINIETGFLPSYDGSQAKLRNLANPTASVGFGTNNPYAVRHDTFDIGSPGILGSLNTGIGTEGGITQLDNVTRITQQSNPIINGITEGIIFEAVVEVPNGSSSAQYVLLHARDASNSTLFELGFNGASSGFYINFGGTTAYAESPFMPPGPATGTYYFCAAIPKVQAGGAPVTLWSNTGAITLSEVGGGLSWNTANVSFTFGSRYDGFTASRQVTRFFSAKVHNITSAWNQAYADDFRNQNWPIVQTLYSL
jgi:hypothetical protein